MSELTAAYAARAGLRCAATDGREFPADRVIVTAGGKSAPNMGSNGGGYAIAKELGHHIIDPMPALVQIRLPEVFGYGILRPQRGAAQGELHRLAHHPADRGAGPARRWPDGDAFRRLRGPGCGLAWGT